MFILRQLRDFYTKMSLPNPTYATTDKAGGVVSALHEVWPDIPHLLCIQHILNNIKAHYKQLWRSKYDQQPGYGSKEERQAYIDHTQADLRNDQSRVWQATSISDYDNAQADLYTKRTKSNHDIIAYLQKTQMSEKEKFYVAQTREIMHFSNAITSRVKRMHHAIKADLPHRHGHLRDVVRTLQAYNKRLNK